MILVNRKYISLTAIIFLLLIASVSILHSFGIPSSFSSTFDKTDLFLHFSFAFTILICVRLLISTWLKNEVVVISFVILIIIIDEFIQIFIPGRNFELSDLTAGFCGITGGWIVIVLFNKNIYNKYYKTMNIKNDFTGKYSILRFIKGFFYAINGIIKFFSTQLNALVHLLAAIVVIVGGLLLGLAIWEWVVVVIVIASVFGAEMLNTSIEKLTDMISKTENPDAAFVKDVAAGAVLIISLGAAITGILIFVPKIFALFGITINW